MVLLEFFLYMYTETLLKIPDSLLYAVRISFRHLFLILIADIADIVNIIKLYFYLKTSITKTKLNKLY